MGCGAWNITHYSLLITHYSLLIIKMNIQKNNIVEGADKKPFLADLYFDDQSNELKPLVIFAHGFKGFKDWGHWDLIARTFVEQGFNFLTFNFSHNGTTIEHPLDFQDLESFGQNNYSKELADLDALLTWVHKDPNISPRCNLGRIALIGHSRGGATAIIKAVEDDRINALITWASVASLDYAWPDDAFIDKWRKEGVYHIMNGRTKQQMPLYFQLYEDFDNNRERFDTKAALKKLNKPMLIVHGTSDPAVPFLFADQLKGWNESASLYLIEGADHVFGGQHPYGKATLPEHTKELVATSTAFLDNCWE